MPTPAASAAPETEAAAPGSRRRRRVRQAAQSAPQPRVSAESADSSTPKPSPKPKAARSRKRTRTGTPADTIQVIQQQVREIEQHLRRARRPANLAYQIQAAALLLRAAIDALPSQGSERATQTRSRLQELGVQLGRAVASDSQLLHALTDPDPTNPYTHSVLQTLRTEAGLPPEAPAARAEAAEAEAAEGETCPPRRAVTPVAATTRARYQIFQEPVARPEPLATGALRSWELIKPLLRAVSEPTDSRPLCAPLPPPAELEGPHPPLMPHQAQLVAAAQHGSRSFLLADEPGLGKTAQALLAAEAAGAWPLLVVCPNVVKSSWAAEARLWTPRHQAVVLHGDGEDLDLHSDIIIVNYDILDRHAHWLTTIGIRGMIVDEAHLIKNKQSQRSQHVLGLAHRLREQRPDALLMALTGTPLVNTTEDLLPLWELLGWIDEDEPADQLMHALEESGCVPGDPGWNRAARDAIAAQGIVRRRKREVAKTLPPRRIADLPVELEGADGRQIRAAEQELCARLVRRYEHALAKRLEVVSAPRPLPVDQGLITQVCAAELRRRSGEGEGENIFHLMRRIGQAKASAAAEHTIGLARSTGKVVLFTIHLDVLEACEAQIRASGLGTVHLRGDQPSPQRAAAIEAFNTQDDIQVIICSLQAAGVGVNLQVASNIVLAELPWTAAAQTQAIDRVHRIGQSDPVTAWRILATGSIDQHVAAILQRKGDLAAYTLDGESRPDEADETTLALTVLTRMLTEALER